MISRIWHGWTTRDNADAYEALLKAEVFVGIRGRNIPGFRSIQLFRRDLNPDVEFVTVMWLLARPGARPPLRNPYRQRCGRTLSRFDALATLRSQG